MHIVSISGFAEVDKMYGRPPKFTNADFIPIARFTPGRWCSSSTISSPTNRSRNW